MLICSDQYDIQWLNCFCFDIVLCVFGFCFIVTFHDDHKDVQCRSLDLSAVWGAAAPIEGGPLKRDA